MVDGTRTHTHTRHIHAYDIRHVPRATWALSSSRLGHTPPCDNSDLTFLTPYPPVSVHKPVPECLGQACAPGERPTRSRMGSRRAKHFHEPRSRILPSRPLSLLLSTSVLVACGLLAARVARIPIRRQKLDGGAPLGKQAGMKEHAVPQQLRDQRHQNDHEHPWHARPRDRLAEEEPLARAAMSETRCEVRHLCHTQ